MCLSMSPPPTACLEHPTDLTLRLNKKANKKRINADGVLILKTDIN